jgi:hypothetical protein
MMPLAALLLGLSLMYLLLCHWLLAAWRHAVVTGAGGSWQAFVEGLARRAAEPVRFTPRPAAMAALDRGYERHRRLVALHAALAAACE